MAEVRNPTYMEHIRHFFEAEDHDCMFPRGKDYSTYTALKNAAIEVYSITRPPNATMPKPVARRWDEDRSKSFLNWITNGHPRGEPTPKKPKTGTADRVRRSISELSEDDVKLLIKAFEGIMDRGTDDPTGYFKIAGIHWYPNTPPDEAYCQHHVAHYHMWHRAYLLQFEDALRSVPGCNTVTLPYWDFAEKLPDWMNRKPFKSYKLPRAVHPAYPKDHATERYSASKIAKNFEDEGILATIEEALKKSSWETFNAEIEGAHDSGHPACGPSLTHPDIASFDPLFWFFHANWDRLWWRWQQIMQATTLWTFRSTFADHSTGIFFVAPLNSMRPNFMTADQTIDLKALGITYTQPDTGVPEIAVDNFGSLLAARGFRAAESPTMSVRIRGIDRLVIPGSFRVQLIANGKSVARRSFFQSTAPVDCPTCRDNALINMDFKVPIKKILGAKMEVKIDVFGRDGKPHAFPLSSVGNPTVNARLPLEI
ncbi:tyrosinase family protein [Pelagibius sp.]|uniref:tyrosinase family protein n=1 Tax=Pelagibius sp. TaxID=1931238 RepID=UPI003B5015F2